MMSPAGKAEAALRYLQGITGADVKADALIGEAVAALAGDPPAANEPYTASVDQCLQLIHQLLPKWHWHTGFGVKGITPYAMLSSGDEAGKEERFEASAPTVPLALLIVLFQALIETRPKL